MRTPAQNGPRVGGARWVMLSLPVVVLAAATALVYVSDDGGAEFDRDADLCLSSGEVSASAAFLVDLTKPVDSDHHALPRELLSNVIGDLEQDAELRVFLLNDSADAPRTELGRLCKPFSSEDLNVASKDYGSAEMRGCDELPAQITPEVRELAMRFCTLQDDLEGVLALAMRSVAGRTQVESSYLVEALEDLRIEMAEVAVPRTLYVFSDMMQHAAWFSHLDLPWQQWSYGELARLREEQGWPSASSDQGAMGVELFYVPRIGSTDQPRIHRVHQRFWREYFANAPVTFHDQAPMREYGATDLTDISSAADLALDARRAAEDLLSQVRLEQERLQEERERLAEQEALHQEQQAERSRWEELMERRAELAQQVSEMQRGALDAEVPAQTAATEPPERVPVEQPGGRRVRQAPWKRADPVTGPQSLPSEVAGAAELAAADIADSLALEPPAEDVTESLARAVAADVACELELTAATADLVPAYPRGGRTNFGEASIAIRYVVNERGETVDAAVQAIIEQSSVQRERYLRLFVDAATDVVRQWRFEVTGANACAFPLERATTFEFAYW